MKKFVDNELRRKRKTTAKTQKIYIDVNRASFKNNLLLALNESETNFNETIGEVLGSEIVRMNEHLLKRGDVLKFKVRVPPYYNQEVNSITEALSAKPGYTVWYLNLEIITKKAIRLTQQQLMGPRVLKWEAFIYGQGVSKYFKFKETLQKNQNKYQITILQLIVPKSLLNSVYTKSSSACACLQKDLRPAIEGAWDWHLHFDCAKCGKKYLCECFRAAINIQLKEDRKWRNSIPGSERKLYERDGWPWASRLIEFIDKVEYKNKICHICTNSPSNLSFTSKMYGSEIMVKYGPYIRKLGIEKRISEMDAENIIREKIGHHKIGEGWINETELFKILQNIFGKKHKIEREATPEWLGKLRLDFYIPSLKLAIEYHGEQHYRPISRFGGEEAFRRGKERDKLKKKLCTKNGIALVSFKFSDRLDVTSIRKKVSKFITEYIPQ